MKREIETIRQATSKIAKILSGSNVRVTQHGASAFVRYNKTTGQPEQLNIPNLPDNASMETIIAIRGFLDHEVAHILFTDPTHIPSGDRALHALHNIVEDCRIEALMERRFHGSAHNLNATREMVFEKEIGPRLAELEARGATEPEWFSALAVHIFRAWAGQAAVRRVMDRYWDKMPSIVSAIAFVETEINDLRSTRDALDLAVRVRDALKDLTEPPAPPPMDSDGDDEGRESEPCDSGEPGDKSSNKDFNPDDHSDPNECKKDESEGSKSETRSHGEELDSDDSDSGDSGDSGDSDSDSGDSDSDSDDSGGDSDSGDSGSDSGEDDGLDDSEDGEATSGSSEDGDEGEDGDVEDAVAKQPDHRSPVTDNPPPFTIEELEEALEELRDEMEAVRDVILKGVIEAGGDWLVYSDEMTKIGKIDGRMANDRDVASLENSVRDVVGPLQKSLERFLMSQNRVRWQPGLRRGVINSAALHRLQSNDDRVFKRREVQRAPNASVGVLIDLSGSMYYGRMRPAMEGGFALAQALERCRIECEVLGFTTKDTPSELVRRIHASQRDTGAQYSVIDEINYMPHFKDWSEKVSTAEIRGRFARYWNLDYRASDTPCANNADPLAVETAMRRVAARSNPKKILMVLSDGDPAFSHSHHANIHARLKEVVESGKDFGVSVIGVGIQTNAVRRYYPHHVVINSADDLPKVMLSEIRDLLAA